MCTIHQHYLKSLDDDNDEVCAYKFLNALIK